MNVRSVPTMILDRGDVPTGPGGGHATRGTETVTVAIYDWPLVNRTDRYDYSATLRG